jgi:hypothetical protein
MTGIALNYVDARVSPFGVIVVPRRHVHPERALVRIAEVVAAQGDGVDD